MPLSLKSTGGGNVSLDVTATASNYTVNIPTTTGTLVAGDSATGALVLPSGSTTDRPAVPYNGATRWNSTLNRIEIFSNFDWYDINSPIDPIYNINRSLRFRASASAYLSRTPASAGNRQVWTWSGWVKRGTLSSAQRLFEVYNASPNYQTVIRFESADTLSIFSYDNGSFGASLTTTQVFRDPSSWYHIVIAFDTTQATSSNRIKMYVNGSQITAFGTATYPAQNYNGYINTTYAHYFGTAGAASIGAENFDGYLAENVFIDGQALTPSSFGRYNVVTGVWMPIAYTGTYGTNGFYLPFTDNSALTTSSNVGLGKDFSGNGNYWVTNNISITSGVTYDSMTDVPTLTSATAANFAVLNPLQNAGSVSSANLNYSATTTAVQNIFGTMALPPTQKIYFEVTYATGTASGSYASVGVTTASLGLSTAAGSVSGSWAIESNQAIDAINRDQGPTTSYGAGSYFSTGQVCMIAVDQAAGKIWYGKNGTWFASGDPAAGTNASATDVSTTATLFPVSTAYGTTPVLAYNFGQRPFAYTPPSGFVALNAYNLPDSTIKQGNKVMDATLYTGNGSTQTITNAAGFKPDLVWYKSRSAVYDNGLFDSVRGASNWLASNNSATETASYSGVSAFNSNGFSLGSGVNGNNNATTYVGWQWQAGQGSSSTNTSGTITSTVSVNASAGFSVVTFTGTQANATVGHGLGVPLSLLIVKARSSAQQWMVWHSALAGTQYLHLNTTEAVASASTPWNSTVPTSSVFSLGADGSTNTSGASMVAYCWAEIPGYSKFGKYTGNGSADGPFVYCGFRPRWVLMRNSSVSQNWIVMDTARDYFNQANKWLLPNQSYAESSGSAGAIDILSNGFKIRNSDAGWNGSGNTMIYAAFAENPFKNSLAR